jgi:heme-degrading monooxygenase HmoA
MLMVQFIWEFIARDDKTAEFERSYSASGLWAALFESSPGFLGAQLLRDSENPRRYVTIDRWESFEAHVAMRGRLAKEYEELDRRCEGLTEFERRIGVFEEE